MCFLTPRRKLPNTSGRKRKPPRTSGRRALISAIPTVSQHFLDNARIRIATLPRASSGGALDGASPSLASNPKSPELPFGEFIHLLRQWVFARISALAVLTLSRLAAAHHDVVQVQA